MLGILNFKAKSFGCVQFLSEHIMFVIHVVIVSDI